MTDSCVFESEDVRSMKLMSLTDPLRPIVMWSIPEKTVGRPLSNAMNGWEPRAMESVERVRSEGG